MSATPFAGFNALAKRRRRGIFVETGHGRQRSSVGAAYSDVAPTELNYFSGNSLQRFRAYGAGKQNTFSIDSIPNRFAPLRLCVNLVPFFHHDRH